MNLLTSLLEDRLAILGTGVSVWARYSEVISWAARDRATKSEYVPAITELEEFWNLRNDLRRLELGWVPTSEDISGFVALSDWIPTDDIFGDRGFAMFGTVVKTVRGFDAQVGEMFPTMQVLAVDPDFKWIRDRGAFFALLEPSPVLFGDLAGLM